MARRILLSPNSRYRATPLFSQKIDEQNPNLGENTFFGTFQRIEIPTGDDDTFYMIRNVDNGRLDVLAFDFYGSAELWWVLAVVNQIFDPLFGVEPGTVIRIPGLQKVFTALSEAEIR